MAISHGSTQTTHNATAVQLDGRGVPVALVGDSQHFGDLPRNRRPFVMNPQTAIPME